jgi:hypothetical protein
MLYKYLLSGGADPEHCMFAIAWYDDAEAAQLFIQHGARIDGFEAMDSPLLASFNGKKFNAAQWFLQNGADVDRRERRHGALVCSKEEI